MRKTTRPVGAVLISLLVVVVASCSGGSSSSGESSTTSSTSPGTTGGGSGSGEPYEPRPLPSPQTLTLSIPGPFEFVLPVYVAQEKGEFAKENLTVEMITTPATSQFPGLVTGEADVAAIGVSAGAFNAVNQGIPVTFFMDPVYMNSENTRDGIWVRKERVAADGKLDPAEVDGMRVILGTQGKTSPIVYILNEALTEVGKTVDDVEIAVLDPGADSLVALQNGAVDGANLQSPFSNDPGLEDCCVHVIRPVKASAKYAALAEVIEADAEVLEAFTRALVRTNRAYLQGNYHTDPEMSQLQSDFTTLPVDTIRATESYYLFGEEAYNDTVVSERLQQLWLSFGEILGYGTALPVDRYSTEQIIDAVNGG